MITERWKKEACIAELKASLKLWDMLLSNPEASQAEHTQLREHIASICNLLDVIARQEASHV